MLKHILSVFLTICLLPSLVFGGSTGIMNGLGNISLAPSDFAIGGDLTVGGDSSDAILKFWETNDGWNIRHQASNNHMLFKPTIAGNTLVDWAPDGTMGFNSSPVSPYTYYFFDNAQNDLAISSWNDNAILNIIADVNNSATTVHQDPIIYFYSGGGGAKAEIRWDEDHSGGQLELNAQTLSGHQLVLHGDGDVSIGIATATAKLEINTETVGTKGLIVKGISGQTANILEINDGTEDRLVIATDVTLMQSPDGDSGWNVTDGNVFFSTGAGVGDFDLTNTEATLTTSSNIKIKANATATYLYSPDATERVKADNTGVTISGAITKTRIATAVSDNTASMGGAMIYAVTSTAAARTITISSADVVAGRIFIVKDESGAAGTNNITIDTAGSENIDGSATIVISTNYGVVRMYSDGTDLFTY